MTPPPEPETQPGSRIGPYQVLGTLGRGGMATVLRVRDDRDGSEQALKLLHGGMAGPELRARFQAEFQTLKALQHPGILQVHESGEHNGRMWFSMECLEGRDLKAEVEAWEGLPSAERFEKVQSLLAQVTEALAAVHEQGLVHRDITPGNIRVTPSGRAVLMDFGVVHTPGAELTTVGEMVGTVAWISPEQISADISGGRVDPRADLYSLGAVLYYMLTGRRPFQANAIASLLDKHLHQAPRPPREVSPTVPVHLDAICRRLLEKDPAKRYGSARHLLSVLNDHSRAQVDIKSFPVRLVGRNSELSQLREALSQLQAGRGGAVIVEGPPGFGKSALLKEVVKQAPTLGLTVASGRAGRGEHEFGGFDEVIEALNVETLPPPLDIAFGEAQGSLERYQVLTATRDLLRQHLPLVVVLDEVHRARSGAITMLEFLLRNHLHLASDPILFVLGRKPAQLDDDDVLAGLFEDTASGVAPRLLSLQPISVSAVEEMLLQLVPDDARSRTLANRLHREGEGNPMFIAEMIRGLVDQGILTPGEEGFELELDTALVSRARLPIPSSIREALRERLDALSEGALAVAQVLALTRQELTLDVLLEALHTNESDLILQLEELLDAGLVKARHGGMEELYELARLRLRDILMEQMPAPRARALHRRLGASLERLYRHRISSVVEAIAWHFEQGEVPAKAYPYLIRAGRRLQERSFVEEAERYYDRALAVERDAREYMTLEDADRALATLLLWRGLAKEHLGHSAQADADHHKADELARAIGDERLRTRTLSALGADARRDVDLDTAEARYTEALSTARRLGDTSLQVRPLNGIASVRWNKGDLDGARQMWLEALTAAGAVRDDSALAKGYTGLGLVALCKGQAVDARKYLEQSVETFDKLGKLGPLLVARVNLVELCHCTGNLRRALQLADRSITQARETRYQNGVAMGLQYRALVLVDLERLGDARESAAEALKLSERMLRHDDELAVRITLIRVALREHRLEEMERELDRVEQLLGRYDLEGFAPLVAAWRGRLLAERGGDPEQVRALIDAANENADRPWPHQRVRLDLISAWALGAAGLQEEARVRAQAALELAETCGFRFYALKAHTLLARFASDPARLKRHARVSRALARTLAANLGREDGKRLTAVVEAIARGD
ncbi:MAG: protein kinase [Myxococcota bacterium]|nr:protein kinase [Myxococcota bacterium]